MVTLNNPAGRIYNLLLIQTRAVRNNEVAMRDVWKSLSDRYPNTTDAVLHNILGFLSLIRQAKEEIKTLDVDQELYLEPLNVLEKAVGSLQLDQSWVQFQSVIGPTTVYGLRFISELLSRESGEEIPDTASLQKLLSEVQVLTSKVSGSELPGELKDILLDSLNDIQWATIDYRITGPEGLKRSIEGSVGAIVLREEDLQGIQRVESRNLIYQFGQILNRVNDMASASLKVKKLPLPALRLMLPEQRPPSGHPET